MSNETPAEKHIRTPEEALQEYKADVRAAGGKCERCGHYDGGMKSNPLVVRAIEGRKVVLCSRCEAFRQRAHSANRSKKIVRAQLPLPGLAS